MGPTCTRWRAQCGLYRGKDVATERFTAGGDVLPPALTTSVETLPPTLLMVDDRRWVAKCSDDAVQCRR